MRGLAFAVFVVFVPFMGLAVGCGASGRDHRRDDDSTGASNSTGTGAGGSDLFTTTSTGNGGSGGEPACDGECHLWKSALFEDLGMFWIGPPGEAPPCPAFAPVAAEPLYGDLQPSLMICPTCSCSPAGCTLPEQLHVSAAKCPGDGAASIPFDAPAGWEGTCTAEGAIAPGLMCAGVPCTQSLTVDAPTVEPCQPVADGSEMKPDPAWGMEARECILGPLTGEGCDGSEACVPSPPDGFSLCLYRWGDDLTPEHCPAEYPRFLVVYAGADDTRACDPCSCSDPEGAECSVLVSMFVDPSCSAQVASVTVAPDEPACVDLPSGVGLASKAATMTIDTLGSCTPSGGATGGIAPTLSITLCCQPDSNPAP